METAFLLGYHRNRQSLCKPPLIAHIRFPGRLEYLLEDTPPVFRYKYKQILFWSGTHLCLTSSAILYVRVALNIGVTCGGLDGFMNKASHVSCLTCGEPPAQIPFHKALLAQPKTCQNISLPPSCGHCSALVSLNLCWTKVIQQETNKQEMEPKETKRTLLHETRRKQAIGWLQLSKSFKTVAVLTSK